MAVTKPLYDAEIHRWATTLHWDTRATWRQVEFARRAGLLPGFVVEDDGDVTGWAYQLLHRGSLQVGAVVSSSAAATRELLDHVLASEEAGAASSVVVFTYASAPSLVPALDRSGFTVERYRHMECALSDASDGPCIGRAWSARDTPHVAGLMARAYGPGNLARPFAREGDAAAWLEYAQQLTTTNGCGVFAPECSVVVPDTTTSLAAAVLTTVVGSGTGHLAQVAVDPGATGTGLGRKAVRAAMSKLRAAGFERVTLLVGEQNGVARRLYRDLGFQETAEFVSAATDQPRRFTSAALATGGASTFR